MNASNGENPSAEQTWIGSKTFFADKYQNLNLTQKPSAGSTGYHSANAVVQNRDISTALDNPEMSATL